MINEKELLISGKSYINKDFGTVFPEQIDIFKKLTNKYDPETSNESDPGIVLLKTNAFVTDKILYNVDKNALENFMPSCTQESSMRKLCDRMGYSMKYYLSSATNIYFNYIGDVFTSNSTASYFIIPKFTTLSDAEGLVNFVTLKDAYIYKDIQNTTIEALQGDIKELQIADSNIIQLENIDSNNRIYFSESMVAENGVFVTSIDNKEEEWKQTSNLNLIEPNKKFFKFGFDSENMWPYLEFPEDIASLIGSGLNIKYLITNGVNGNVRANYITKIVNTDAFTVYTASDREISTDNGKLTVSFNNDENNKSLVIRNISASIGGANPETIDEAYNNFKRTIGTFDTLVTCRDYANAIYNLYDSDDVYPVVSNCQVGDRRDDINYGNKIITLDEYGTCFKYGNSNVSAYDLCLYPLNAITTYSLETYLNSFKPKLNTTYIENSIEIAKTTSHDYKSLLSSDIYAIKNYYNLDVKLTTTYKVNDYERLDIIQKVYYALIKKFNAREVDYGEEIPYETILNTIKNADERIQYVNLPEPVLSTYFLTTTQGEHNIYSVSGINNYIKILAKNILAGKISLFDTDTTFSYEFNQEDGNFLSQLSSVDTEVEINKDEIVSTEGYPLKKNEVIQFVGPSLVTVTPYSYGILYNFKSGTGISSGDIAVKEGTEYQLQSGDELTVRYTQSGDDTPTIVKYTHSTAVNIIKPVGFDLRVTPDTHTPTSGTTTYDGVEYMMIQSNQEIDTRKLNEQSLESSYYCYWIRNNEGNTLFTANDAIAGGEYETMLRDGEYFFFKKSPKDSFISLSSGTVLKIPNSIALISKLVSRVDEDGKVVNGLKIVELTDVLTKGDSIIPWESIAFNSEDNLSIKETTILTLTEGNSLKIVDNSPSSISWTKLNNSPKEIPQDVEIRYTIEGKTKKLSQYSFDYWKAHSRLDINAGPNKSQTLGANQRITFHGYKGTAETVTSVISDLPLTTGSSFNLNSSVQLVGGENVLASSYDIVNNKPIFPLTVYAYQNIGSDISTYRNESGFLSASVNNTEIKLNNIQDITSGLHLPLEKECVLTIFYNWFEGDLPKIKVIKNDVPGNYIKYFGDNDSSHFTNEITLKKGINVIQFRGIQNENENSTDYADTLVFSSVSGAKGALDIGKLTYYNGFNPALGLQTLVDNNTDISDVSVLEAQLLTQISSIDSENVFYYNMSIDNSKLIEFDDLTSPYAFYDYNNIANKFTISEIDLSSTGSVVDVVRSSRLQEKK